MSDRMNPPQPSPTPCANLPIRLELPPHFLDEECREGTQVSKKLKKIWAVELDLLDSFLQLCRRKGIHCQIFSGTLLGAVRHKGFIPWDDDVDVCMDRENFSKLLQISGAEIPNPYFLQTAFSDRRFFCPYARFRNGKTTAVITNQADTNYNCGIYIDVYVLDGLVHSKIAQRIQFLVLELIQMIISDLASKAPFPKTFVSAFLRVMRPFFRIIGDERFFRFHQHVLSWFNKKADRISLITHGEEIANKYWLYKKEHSDTVEIPFESIFVPATRNYEKVLSRIYGDYMTPPPQSERGKWHEGLIVFDPEVPYRKYFEQKGKR